MAQRKLKNELLDQVYASMVAIDVEAVPKLVKAALAGGQNPMKIVETLTAGITVVGDKFETLECFLPELILAAGAMEEAMAILKPEMEKLDLKVGPAGSVVMANLQGDIHDIGRNIVVAMLRVAGFEVHDLGHDVRADLIIDKAIELKANVIGLSSLLTTSLPYARDVLALLAERGVRDRFKVAMGGGAVTPEFSRDIGADGYAHDAASAVRLMAQLVERR